MSGNRITDSVSIIAMGERAGSATAVAMPSVPGAKWVKFKAKTDNAGNVHVGFAGVTAAAGTTTTTAGWPIDAGQETDWLPVPGGNLSSFYIIGDNAGDDVSYLCLG